MHDFVVRTSFFGIQPTAQFFIEVIAVGCLKIEISNSCIEYGKYQ